MVISTEDRLFNWVTIIILALIGLVALIPVLYVVSVSLTPFGEVLKNGGYVLIPKQLTFSAYQKLLETSNIFNALKVTVYVTVIGTAVNLVLTALMAYPLSRKQLPWRSFFLGMVILTMLFGGGIIPTYLIVKATGLIDTIWSMILPGAIWSFNVLVMKSFFESLPEELFEAARIDGAKEFRILCQIVVPLSKPSLITIGLFYAVGHWNQFFAAIMYISDRQLFPLQVVVREILMMTQQPLESAETMVPTMTMQMSAIVLASLPIIVVYPFLQRHFTKGMMLGSIKG